MAATGTEGITTITITGTIVKAGAVPEGNIAMKSDLLQELGGG